MKYLAIILCLLIFSLSVFSQKAEKILAAADGLKFTADDIPENARAAYDSFPKLLAQRRGELLDEQIAEILLETEANARKIPIEKLIETEISSKIPAPSDEQVKSVYEASRAQVGDKTLEEVRPQIVAFLRRDPEQKAYTNLLAQLKTKQKVVVGKDINAPNLKSFEVLATVGGKQVTVADYEKRNKLKLVDFEGNFYDQIRDELEEVVFNALVAADAKAQNITAGNLIAREVTDKMREFSDEERSDLQNDLKRRLFAKYHAKVLLEEPAPLVQNISTDDDPFEGRRDAPVTVVMFSDFQCPACASFHSVLKKVLAEYGDKTRFVVRDFPLLNVHKNAFRAALAADAANAQGKFFEYTDVLYKNQEKLDDESLKKYAADLGLNIKQFALDLNDEKFAAEVKKDLADGKEYGITGTPTIFVNGIKLRQLSAQGLRDVIDKALKK